MNPVAPPPKPPTVSDPVMNAWFVQVYRWLGDIYRKTGEASNKAPIIAETIYGDVAPTQLAAPVPVELGGTGATDAAAAAATLNLQTAIDPGAAGFVPVSTGSGLSSRKLAVDDIDGAFSASKIQTKRGISLIAPAAGAGNTADTPVTWTTPFDDVNYSISLGFNGTGGVISVVPGSQTETGFTIRLTNITASAASGSADAQGVHD